MNTRFATLFALLCAVVVALASAHVDHEVARQLQELREQNELMRAELAKYRKAIESAGGERVAEPESFMEVAEESEDPSIQCQTICKFVRPNVGKDAEAEAEVAAEEATEQKK
jgi:hypothetical protein|eukprot:g1140.t1